MSNDTNQYRNCVLREDGLLSRRNGVWILVAVTVLVACAAAWAPRVAQPRAYHHFADQRGWLGIPNFGDVASNLAFVIVGLWGLAVLLRKQCPVAFLDTWERWLYLIVFAGMIVVAVGSSSTIWLRTTSD